MADLFPDGFRRLLANNLTGDDFIKGLDSSRMRMGFQPLMTRGTPVNPLVGQLVGVSSLFSQCRLNGVLNGRK